MTKYDVTLTIPVRIHGERQLPGTIVEVDETLLEELEKHNAVTDVKEKKAQAKKTPAKKEAPIDESGE